MAWTEQQNNAIEIRDCGVIVSAAAGSGKTSVLVERLLRILMDEEPSRRVPADRMIVVTFTNDAAAEMKARLYQALDDQLQKQPDNRWLYQQQILLQNAHICTISSFCFELIRDNLTADGITSSFRILNDTESNLMASKAIDKVMNRWHTKRATDMDFLWNCFCEKNDTPLEKIILELHQFLTSVPFRDNWKTTVLNQLSLPLEKSIFHQSLLQTLQEYAETALQEANEAAALAADLYDDIDDNTVLPWVEQDCRCIEAVVQMIRNKETDANKMAEPLLVKRESRSNKRFPTNKKNITSLSDYKRVKLIRGKYDELEKECISLLQTAFPYEQEDIDQHLKIVPLLFALESDLSDEIWQMKLQQNVLGFDDGERLALELLAFQTPDHKIHPSPLAKEMSEFYQLIMIDEYQDTNNKQDSIFKLLSRNCVDSKTGDLRYGDNVFLVGDVKQSIYRFRLANPQNFVHAINSSNDENSLCKHIALNRNFRSTPAVLSFVNFLCGNLMSASCGDVVYNEEEALQAGSDIGERLPQEEQAVHIAILDDENIEQAQVEYTIRQIQNMIQQGTVVAEKDGTTRPCQYQDFCVLLRSNSKCLAFSHAMENAGIPVQSPDEKGYLQAREISILLDMLRVLDNPLIDTSLAAIMLSPMFWFTAQELMEIRMQDKRASLYIALCQAIDEVPRKSNAPIITDVDLQKKCRYLYDTLQKLRQDAMLMTLESLIRHIYDTTDFLSVMQLTQGGDRKRANLHLLLQYAKQYEENTEASHNGVSGFLRYIDWLIESGNDFQQTTLVSGAENAVVVKTMHRSKGLEYPFVFLGNLEVTFSNRDKQQPALFSDHNMIGLRINDPTSFTHAKTLPYLILEKNNENLSKSEELRLLYVAMTRAKQQLFIPLTTSKIRTKNKNLLSDFATSISLNGKIPDTLVQSANSMGQWVWMCLLLLHDDALDKIISLPEKTWDTPEWAANLKISYTSEIPAREETIQDSDTKQFHANHTIVSDIQDMIAFQYHSQDSKRESLLSVSAIQENKNHRPPIWKRPRFLQETTKLTGAERGTAIHTFFQYADFQLAEQDATAEIARLQKYGFLSREQAAVVVPDIIHAFLADPLYQRLRRSTRILREQKFLVQCKDLSLSPKVKPILQEYYQSDSMLKGIIDLAFLENDSYILVDYKTDAVSEPNELIHNYLEQLTLYQAALQCITGMPVQQCYLYSTHLKKSIEVKL